MNKEFGECEKGADGFCVHGETECVFFKDDDGRCRIATNEEHPCLHPVRGGVINEVTKG